MRAQANSYHKDLPYTPLPGVATASHRAVAKKRVVPTHILGSCRIDKGALGNSVARNLASPETVAKGLDRETSAWENQR